MRKGFIPLESANKSRKRNFLTGFTLIELLITVGMFVVLTAVAVYIFKTVLLTWSSQETRGGIDISIGRGTEQMVRDLRSAREAQSTADYNEMRFTKDLTNYYIYYLYNAGDSYVPPPNFNQSSYQLRKAQLTGGMAGTFTYDSGDIILTDVLPPPTSTISMSGNLVTIDLSVKTRDETIRTRTEVRPRNL